MSANRCSGHTFDGSVCSHPVTHSFQGNHWCIYHAPSGKKKLRDFARELDRLVDAQVGDALYRDEIDCTGFVFPVAGLQKRRFLRRVYFGDSVFDGRASFVGCDFQKEADFSGAEFRESAMFNGATFRYGADFSDARSTPKSTLSFYQVRFLERMPAMFTNLVLHGAVDFNSAQFHADAYFNCAEFRGDTQFKHGTTFHQQATFSGAKFLGGITVQDTRFTNIAGFAECEFAGRCRFVRVKSQNELSMSRATLDADSELLIDCEQSGGARGLLSDEELYFTKMRLHPSSTLIFRKVWLDKARFLETDVSKVEFVDVGWPCRKLAKSSLMRLAAPSWDMGRAQERGIYAIRDELVLDNDGVRLHRHLLSQLYRGLQANCIDRYQYGLAGHFYIGQQEVRRIGRGPWRQYFSIHNLYRVASFYGQSYLLPLFWLTVTFLSFTLFMLYDGWRVASGGSEVNYGWSWSPADVIVKYLDFWQALGANLSMATLNRRDMSVYLLEPYQKGIVTLESGILLVLISLFVLALRRRFKRKSF